MLTSHQSKLAATRAAVLYLIEKTSPEAQARFPLISQNQLTYRRGLSGEASPLILIGGEQKYISHALKQIKKVVHGDL